jgi:23S rRNA (cytidine1920-2'-O)/16S rRNA (cytidine1409-2'-O)-methyltransferase
VTAVDVGYGQLAWSLRNDPRVRVLERTNARHVNPSMVGGPFDLICADLSFISLTKILPATPPLLKPDGRMVMLVKPQFEAGREQVGKKGVVRDPSVHREVINKVLECAGSLSLSLFGLTYSPITGPEGNIEYLVCFAPKMPETFQPIGLEEIGKIVEEAAATLSQARR